MKNVSDLEIKTLTCKLSHVLCYFVIFFSVIRVYENIRIGSVMATVLVLGVVDRGFGPQSGKPKGYKIGIVAFPLSTQH